MIPTILVTAALFLPAHAQDQQPKRQAGWPCKGTVDSTYIRTAEATGGAVLMFQPGEIDGLAADYVASERHPETVFRAAGPVEEGLHHFDIPVDSTMESVYFFASLQCLKNVTIVRPDGAELRAGSTDVESHHFNAVRLFVVRNPLPGTWKVGIAGRGLLFLIVNAQTDLDLTHVDFEEDGAPVKDTPTPGKRARLQTRLVGSVTDVRFQLISMSGTSIQPLDLKLEKEDEIDRTYGGEMLVPRTPFRVAVTATDARGFTVRRVQRNLVIPEW
jgi:hypothetical protein